jgi:2-polyprenyl-3-methyl-5-hydroxy-6-metoxy-1,4-benzoquinol methylase
MSASTATNAKPKKPRNGFSSQRLRAPKYEIGISDMTLDVAIDQDLQEKILAENRRVHALESGLYLQRHPEQTNFFQAEILRRSIERFCAELASPESHILDLGCGTGYLTLPLLKCGHRITGVDLSREMLEILQLQIPPSAKSRSAFTDLGVEEFLDTDTKSYDAVVLSALLHHLYDYESTVRKICRKLSSGGCLLIFFEPLKQKIASSPRFNLHKILARLDESLYKLAMRLENIPLFEEDYELSDYQRQFGGIDPNRLIEILRSMDMEIIDTEKYCSRRYGLPAYFATHLLGTQNTFNLLAKKK